MQRDKRGRFIKKANGGMEVPKIITRQNLRYKIKPENVVAHSDIAPDRKFDPGQTFPWEIFCQNGISINPNRRPIIQKD